jgi:AhpD family alkylhydroperoxidase
VTTTEDFSAPAVQARIPVSAAAVNPQTGNISAYADYDPKIREARAAIVTAAKPGKVLDPLTSELVRLRNAALQGCQFCGSFRSGVAQDRGMNEPMVEDVFGDYESSGLLSERSKVALRLVDAFILGFGHVPADLARQSHEHFTDAELAAIGLRVLSSSTNKVGIALGTDKQDPKEAYGLRNLEEYFPDYDE